MDLKVTRLTKLTRFLSVLGMILLAPVGLSMATPCVSMATPFRACPAKQAFTPTAGTSAPIPAGSAPDHDPADVGDLPAHLCHPSPGTPSPRAKIHAYESALATTMAKVGGESSAPSCNYAGHPAPSDSQGPNPRPSLVSALLPLLACRRPRRTPTRNTPTTLPQTPSDRPHKYCYDDQASPRRGVRSHHYNYRPIRVLIWPSRDPIGERGGGNLYGMVGNDAVNWVDFLGLWPDGFSGNGWGEYDPAKTGWEKDGHVNVDACTAYLVFAHSGDCKDLKWNFNGTSNVGGYIGCNPGGINPKEESDQRWPSLPTHNDNMGMDNTDPEKDWTGGMNEKRNQHLTDIRELLEGKGRGAAESSSPEALKRALGPEVTRELYDKLCGTCKCDEVKYVIEIRTGEGVEGALRKAGFGNLADVYAEDKPIFGSSTLRYSRVFSCKKGEVSNALFFNGHVTGGLTPDEM